MGREMKFRAWSGKMHMLDPKFNQFSGSDLIEEPDWIVMQWTGLIDKNGKEVYEDDMFRRNGHLGIVRFRKGRFVIEFDDGKLFDLHAQPDYDWWLLQNEVIGTIHENPELLK